MKYGVAMIDISRPDSHLEQNRANSTGTRVDDIRPSGDIPLSTIFAECKIYLSNESTPHQSGGIPVQAAHPISSIIPSSHGAVLEVLARTDVPLSARAIARLTDGRVSHTQANTVLKSLNAAGIVIGESRPPSNLYTLNRRHVAADPIAALASMRIVLFDRMSAAVTSWDPEPAAVWVFGSFARGTATTDSDIDVVVVRTDFVDEDDPEWQRQLAQFEQDVRDWSGNDCRTIEFGRQEFDELIASEERLPTDVAHDGIHLFGDPIPRGAIRRGQP